MRMTYDDRNLRFVNPAPVNYCGAADCLLRRFG